MHFKHISGTSAAVLCLVTTLLFCISAVHAAATAKRTLPNFIAGADISLLPTMEADGVVYKDNGKPDDALKILRAHGFNTMRLRLWTKPSGAGVMVNDLPYTIALAKRAKAAGFLVLLDIHYSDTWADPGKQFKPAAWSSLSTDQLVAQVHDYTHSVVASMRKAGAMPDMVQIGNEITGGMLWPDGKNWGPGHDFTILGRLLKAGISGADDGAGNLAPPLTMIHIDKGADWQGTKWFFDGISGQGVNFDVIGLSYYPQQHGPIAGLKETLQNAAARYKKPIVVVETAYPYKSNTEPITPGLTYPETPEGQQQYMLNLIALVRSTPNGLGAGVCYWEPEWLPTKGHGGAWNTTALFDDNGNALPAINVYNEHRKFAQSK